MPVTILDGEATVAAIRGIQRALPATATPTPGGVGPMTRAMLLRDVVLAAEQRSAIPARP